MNKKRSFTPETGWFTFERTYVQCDKPDNHAIYKPVSAINDEMLPSQWRIPEMSTYLKLASRLVVHLTVLEQSPSRISQSQGGISCGTGCLTFHPSHGAIVHTSKHVVYDPYEAERTIVRLFFDDENTREVDEAVKTFVEETFDKLKGNFHEAVKKKSSPDFVNDSVKTGGLFMCLGNRRHFQSVMCSDYTSFSCNLPVHELFNKEEIDKMSKSFSWFNFSVRKFFLKPPTEIDIAIISHPHGYQKTISFGRMNRLCSVQPALHDAATCGGSSGAPLIRLNRDTHHLSIGQFVHHGHNKDILDLGVGTVRPPWAFPYVKCLDTENTLTNAIDILYEPLFYWTLFLCDLLQLESTFSNIIDVFAYTSSLSALILKVQSTWFKVLFCFYCGHLLLSLGIHWFRTSLYFSVCSVMCTLISMCMFPTAWLILYLCPWPWVREVTAILVWILILYIERYFSLSHKFQRRMIGSFTEVLQIKLQHELGVKAKLIKKSDKLITNFFKN